MRDSGNEIDVSYGYQWRRLPPGETNGWKELVGV